MELKTKVNKNERVTCGVIGVGHLGMHHARLYSELENAKLVGVFDTDTLRAKVIADQYGCEAFPSVAALAKKCRALSVVTPTTMHAATAIPLLEAGCHLLVEKPLCTNLAEAEAMIAAAEAHHCILQVGHVEHFNPVNGYLETHVRAPKYITADRLSPFPNRGTDVGVTLDLMIHDLGVVLQLVRSPVRSIEAIGIGVLSQTEDIANARLHFENGCVADFNTSRVSTKKERTLRIFQPGGYLSMDFMAQSGHRVWKEAGCIRQEAVPLQKTEPLKAELKSFIDCILHAHAPKVDGYVARSALSTALEITRQIQSKGLVS